MIRVMKQYECWGPDGLQYSTPFVDKEVETMEEAREYVKKAEKIQHKKLKNKYYIDEDGNR